MKNIKKLLLKAQQNEITESLIYQKLAKNIKNTHNKHILEHIAKDELKHYEFWKKHTNQDVKPNKIKIRYYLIISKLFGLSFGLKFMERGENMAQGFYKKLINEIPDIKQVIQDEEKHEHELINLIKETKLEYIGSMVLGLNDALVELTGALAGLTLALQNTRLIALTGLITGIAASLSMASSEYLSTKSEKNSKNPIWAAIYTGIAYICTVILLIIPFFIFTNVFISLGITILISIIIILFFSFYVSVIQEITFKRHFFEMAGLSLGVALISFIIGYLVRYFFHIEI